MVVMGPHLTETTVVRDWLQGEPILFLVRMTHTVRV